MLEEIDNAMERFLPCSEHPTPVQIYGTLARIVAQVSGRLFVGPDLCRDPAYIDCAVQYSLEVITAAGAVKRIHPWLRPMLAFRAPEVVLLRERERRAMKILGTVIKRRKEAEETDPTWQKPDDMMQWMMARSNESLAKLTIRQLVLTFAAIHTTTTVATNVIYTLAAAPEYIPELRDEIQSVMAAHDGFLTARALQQLLKLDSYMREVSLQYPAGLSKCIPLVASSFTTS